MNFEVVLFILLVGRDPRWAMEMKMLMAVAKKLAAWRAGRARK